jgi:hypothetical protein
MVCSPLKAPTRKLHSRQADKPPVDKRFRQKLKGYGALICTIRPRGPSLPKTETKTKAVNGLKRTSQSSHAQKPREVCELCEPQNIPNLKTHVAKKIPELS